MYLKKLRVQPSKSPYLKVEAFTVTTNSPMLTVKPGKRTTT
jgi:hypothetical protein